MTKITKTYRLHEFHLELLEAMINKSKGYNQTTMIQASISNLAREVLNKKEFEKIEKKYNLF